MGNLPFYTGTFASLILWLCLKTDDALKKKSNRKISRGWCDLLFKLNQEVILLWIQMDCQGVKKKCSAVEEMWVTNNQAFLVESFILYGNDIVICGWETAWSTAQHQQFCSGIMAAFQSLEVGGMVVNPFFFLIKLISDSLQGIVGNPSK